MLARLRAMTRRQRALLAAAAGAAAAGVYVAVSWHLDTWREQERLVAARVLEQQREEEARDRTEEKKLHEHFDSIQRISDTTTLPSLLPALRERLYRLVDVDTLTARLIAARGAEALPPAEKYAAWEELAVLSFARTLSAAWSVCLLDLLLRVQLNLLGSHLYISSTFAGVEASRVPLPPGVPPMPRRAAALTPASQHRYLTLANYFPMEGVAAMVPRVVAACRRVLAGVPLKATLSHGELVALLGRIQEAFELDVAGGRPDACDAGAPWAALLLPPVDPFALPPLGSPQPAAEDAHLLAALSSETRDAVRGGRFAAVLRHALDAAALVLAGSLRGAFEPYDARLPLAKLVPAVAAATDEALLPPPPPPRSVAVRQGIADEDVAASGGDEADAVAVEGASLDTVTELPLPLLADADAPPPPLPRLAAAGGVAGALAALRPVDSFCADLFSSV